MAVDLHLHSTASDGADSPERVMELAAKAGLSHAALMDHDTLAGVDEARQAARVLGIEFTQGVELSVDYRGGKLHMLVYFLSSGEGPLQDQLAGLRAGRDTRNPKIIAKLNELGYDITMDEVRGFAEGPSIGRPHIADALVAKGYVKTRNDAFADLLNDGGAAYAERDRLTAAVAIGLSRASGAVPVIAHPVTMRMNRDEYSAAFRDLTDLGLGGIEAYHPQHDPDLRIHLAGIAAQLGIAATGGSDYHGEGKRGFRVGVGSGDLRVPDSAIEDLRQQLNR